MFWLLVILAAVNLLSFVFFLKETFRKQRSLTYQNVLRRRLEEREAAGVEKQENGSGVESETKAKVSVDEIKLSLKDVNPFPPLKLVLKRWNNIAILFASGVCNYRRIPYFGFTDS